MSAIIAGFRLTDKRIANLQPPARNNPAPQWPTIAHRPCWLPKSSSRRRARRLHQAASNGATPARAYRYRDLRSAIPRALQRYSLNKIAKPQSVRITQPCHRTTVKALKIPCRCLRMVEHANGWFCRALLLWPKVKAFIERKARPL